MHTETNFTGEMDSRSLAQLPVHSRSSFNAVSLYNDSWHQEHKERMTMPCDHIITWDTEHNNSLGELAKV